MRYVVHVEADTAPLTIEAGTAQEARTGLLDGLNQLHAKGERGQIEAHVIGYDGGRQVLDLDLRGPIDDMRQRLGDAFLWSADLAQGLHAGRRAASKGPSL